MSDAAPPESADASGPVPQDEPFQQELLFDADAPDAVVSRSVLDTVLDPETVVEQIAVEPPPALRPVAGGRHEARERAVHLLYEATTKDRPADEVLADQVIAADEYTEAIVRGVGEHAEQIDEVISRLARGWTIARMPTLDVVVLRVACFELAYRDDVPTGVVLSEAVDLAGRYGTDESSRFVNGLLASAAEELRTA